MTSQPDSFPFEYFIKNELFIVVPPMTALKFVDYCKERGVDVTLNDLENLERLGIMRPIARSRRRQVLLKVQNAPDGMGKQIVGVLADGEAWEGETQPQIDTFTFPRTDAPEWVASGDLWDPSTQPFEPWSTFNDSESGLDIESFYSLFQALTIQRTHGTATLKISLPEGMDKGGDYWISLPERVVLADQAARPWIQRFAREAEDIARVCQLISNRYYWETRTDRRQNRQSLDMRYFAWDWDEFRRSWVASTVLGQIGTDRAHLDGFRTSMIAYANHIDPLADWYSIVQFVAVDRKDRLAGSALLAQLYWSMEKMLRQFLEEITGSALPVPHEPEGFTEAFFGKQVAKNNRPYLEYLTNLYHLNPRPRVIVAVEGWGEYEQIPRIAHNLFGYELATLDVELLRLDGISEFTGGKGDWKSGGAMRRFVDDNHARGTVVLLLFDNEAGSKKVRTKLLNAASSYDRRRYVTRAEYVRMWNVSFEFDNFSDAEIARALTATSEGRYAFTSAEVAGLRAKAGKADELSKHYEQKLGYGLNKRTLAKHLVDRVIIRGEKEIGPTGRPRRGITRFVAKIVQVASSNHPIVGDDVRSQAQASGFFGRKRRKGPNA